MPSFDVVVTALIAAPKLWLLLGAAFLLAEAIWPGLGLPTFGLMLGFCALALWLAAPLWAILLLALVTGAWLSVRQWRDLRLESKASVSR